MSLSTLDQVLFGERGFTSKLAAYADGRGKMKGEALEEALTKTHKLKVAFRLPGDAAYSDVCDRAVKPGFNPMLVGELVRDAVEEEYGSNPRGEVKITFYPSGGSGDPPIRVFREVVSVALSSDPEVDFLKQRLAEERADKRHMLELWTTTFTGQQQMVGKVVEELRHIAVTRAAASSIADGGGGVVGMLALYLGLPMMKRMMGLRKDATMEDIADRFGMLTQQSLQAMGEKRKLATGAQPEGGAGWDEVDGPATVSAELAEAEVPLLEDGESAVPEAGQEEELQDHHLVMLLKLGDTLSDEEAKQGLIKRVMALAHENDIAIPDFLMTLAVK